MTNFIKSIIFIFLMVFMVNQGFAQQYISVEPDANPNPQNSQAALNQQPITSQTRASQSSVPHFSGKKPVSNSWNKPNPWQRKFAPSSESEQPKPAQVTQATNQPAAKLPQMAKKTWFKHCLGSVGSGKAAQHANQFCSCGWQYIENGDLPLNLLTSAKPADIQKANQIMRSVMQMCMVNVMAKQ